MARALNSTALQLTWLIPLTEDRNGVIRRYSVSLTEKERGIQLQQVTTATTLVLTSLHPHYTYNLTVAAETVALGPYSEPVTVQLPEDGECMGK